MSAQMSQSRPKNHLDPDQFTDSLPQPYRMIVKIIEVIALSCLLFIIISSLYRIFSLSYLLFTTSSLYYVISLSYLLSIFWLCPPLSLHHTISPSYHLSIIPSLHYCECDAIIESITDILNSSFYCNNNCPWVTPKLSLFIELKTG